MRLSEVIHVLQQAQVRLGDRPLLEGVVFGRPYAISRASVHDGDHLGELGCAVLMLVPARPQPEKPPEEDSIDLAELERETHQASRQLQEELKTSAGRARFEAAVAEAARTCWKCDGERDEGPGPCPHCKADACPF